MRPWELDVILEDLNRIRATIRESTPSLVFGMTDSEIAEWKQAVVAELQMDASFKILTWLESQLRQDFNMAVQAPRTDPLSKLFQEHVTEQMGRGGPKPDLPLVLQNTGVVQVIELVQRHVSGSGRPELQRLCADVRHDFTGFRNWYAHGRYFQVRPVPPKPVDVYVRAQQLVRGIALRFPASPDPSSSL